MGLLQRFDQKEKRSKTTFEGAYQAHYRTIVRRIAFLTGDVHIAEELAQEVFIKLYQAPPDHENVIGWLNTVAARTAYNHIRDDRAHKEKEIDHFKPEAMSLASAEDLAIQNDENRMTTEVLNLLGVRDRTCLLMKHSGYKYAEIADCLEIDINAVGTLIGRAQKKFKELYQKQMESNNEQGGVQ